MSNSLISELGEKGLEQSVTQDSQNHFSTKQNNSNATGKTQFPVFPRLSH